LQSFSAKCLYKFLFLFFDSIELVYALIYSSYLTYYDDSYLESYSVDRKTTCWRKASELPVESFSVRNFAHSLFSWLRSTRVGWITLFISCNEGQRLFLALTRYVVLTGSLRYWCSEFTSHYFLQYGYVATPHNANDKYAIRHISR